MGACVSQGGMFECQRCADGVTSEPCCSCTDPSTRTMSSTTDTVTSTTGTSRSRTEVTSTTTTTTRASGQCRSWCEGNTRPWQQKCSWTKCAGCSDCFSRRLRGNAIFPKAFLMYLMSLIHTPCVGGPADETFLDNMIGAQISVKLSYCQGQAAP